MSANHALLRLVPPLIALAALAAVVLAGRWAALAPLGYLPHPVELATLGLLLLGASLHRVAARRRGEPAELPAPGLGSAAVPPLVVLYGTVPAALVAGLSMLLQQPLHRALARRAGVEQDRRWLPDTLEAAGGTALAALVGGGAWVWSGPGPMPDSPGGELSPAAAAAGGGAYLAVLATALWFHHRRGTGTTEARRSAAVALAVPVATALIGWLLGVVVAGVAGITHRTLAILLLAPVSLLACEAARLRLLWEGARRQLSGLDVVHRAGQRMAAGGREMDLVVDRLHTECREVVPFSWFQFELLAPEVERRSWGAGPDGKLFEGVPEPPPHPPALPGFHRRTPWQRIERELEAEGVRVARLILWRDPRRLAADELRLWENLLPQMAASVHRALLDREAKEDPLTGVAVRRVLERRLAEVHREARENGASFAVVLCDLDHFKRINDTFGHPAGDRALVAAARALEGALRSRDDLLARYGGEEFTVLLEGADGATALAVAERLRRAVAAVELSEEGNPIRLTLSAGVAAFPELHVKTAGELLLLADGALYEAKRQGRDRCLLDLGRGRYQDGQGRLLEAESLTEPPEPPRFFS